MEKEHLKQSVEKEKSGLQQYQVDLIKAGMIVGNAEGSESSLYWNGSEIVFHLKLPLIMMSVE